MSVLYTWSLVFPCQMNVVRFLTGSPCTCISTGARWYSPVFAEKFDDLDVIRHHILCNAVSIVITSSLDLIHPIFLSSFPSNVGLIRGTRNKSTAIR